MEVLIAILATIIILFLIGFLFLKLSTPYAKMIIDEAINISCYLNTYHYMDSEWDRIELRKRYVL